MSGKNRAYFTGSYFTSVDMRYFVLSLFILIFSVSAVHGQIHISGKSDSLIEKGLDYTISCRFQSALHTFQQVIENDRNHPAGYCFKAVTYGAMMMDFETFGFRRRLFSYIDTTMTLCERMIEYQEDPGRTYFYLGCASILRALGNSKSRDLLPAVYNARKGLVYFNQAIETDSTLFDAYLVLGVFDYLLGTYFTYIDWLPGIEDDRERGRHRLTLAAEKGKYMEWAAVLGLGWIAYDRENFHEARRFFEKGANRYPESRFFLWALADTYYRLEDHEMAIAVYQKIYTAIQDIPVKNEYNRFMIHFRIARSEMALEHYSEALTHCDAVFSMRISTDTRDKIHDTWDQMKRFRRDCRRGIKKSGTKQ